jgi:hypothetical protein
MRGCGVMVARRHFLCGDHYAMVPKWLQVKLAQALAYGIAWKCHPTQDYIDLRSQAIQLARRALDEKYSRPSAAQIPLLPST